MTPLYENSLQLSPGA